jgi:hypothetical protein
MGFWPMATMRQRPVQPENNEDKIRRPVTAIYGWKDRLEGERRNITWKHQTMTIAFGQGLGLMNQS